MYLMIINPNKSKSMKKFLLFCLMMVCAGVYAQKSYININASIGNSSYIRMSGDYPSGMQNDSYGSIGNVLNKLSTLGYEVEFMCGVGDRITYLLSKNSGSSSSTRSVRVDDGEVKEVARYNLQGRPVKKNEKGIHVIVYSNYTTKTIIIE